jgi:putative endonuclease
VSERQARGRRAEAAVEDYLVVAGFEIVGRNVRLGALEIDLIARRGPLAVIVEVRSRGAGSFQGGLESITPRKQATLLRAAERAWHERIAKIPGIERMRIDVAAVTFDGSETRVEYIEGAITD